MALPALQDHLYRRVGLLLKERFVRNPYRLTRLAVVALAMVLPAAGCKSTGAARAPSGQTGEAFVRVENRSMLDMTIYVVRGGERRRLGLVNALSTQVLQIPRVLVSGSGVLRFMADPIGGSRTPVSEEIFVKEGDVVHLMIPPQ